ncbi:MAG: hypothetical protein KAR47_02465 [Planctomycetes bacterium]|nr:hypothetical protein [Planctomycetota bacterium]
MGGWRSRILRTLIIYFAGFATAIYVLVPVTEKTEEPIERVSVRQSHNGFKSEDFVETVSAKMHRFAGFAEEKAVELSKLVRAKLAERQLGSGK